MIEIAGFLALLLYATGLLAMNSQYMRYGLNEYELFKLRYVWIGIDIWLPLVLGWTYVPRIHEFLSEIHGKHLRWGLAVVLHGVVPIVFWYLVASLLHGLPVPEYFAYCLIASSAALLSRYVLGLADKLTTTQRLSLGPLKYGAAILMILMTCSIFARECVPVLPAQTGGCRPIEMTVILKSECASDFSGMELTDLSANGELRCEAMIETSENLVVRTKDGDTIRLHKDCVVAVMDAKPAPTIPINLQFLARTAKRLPVRKTGN